MVNSIDVERDLMLPSRGGCQICWKGEDCGLLVKNDVGGWVHQHCLDWFDVDSVSEYEAEYY